MTMISKLDMLELIIVALKEHEKKLDAISEKYEKIVERFENESKSE